MVKNNGVSIWMVVIIAIVVAVIVSFATVSLTGNTVKVPTSVSTAQTTVYSTNETYSRAEVDIKLKSINLGVLSMLQDKCVVTNSVLYNASVNSTGKDICLAYNKKYTKNTSCVIVQTGRGDSVIASCNIPISVNLSPVIYVMCCTP